MDTFTHSHNGQLLKKALDCTKYLTAYDLGFFAFSKMACNDDYQKGFTPELEFDIAGEVKLAGSFYSFETRDLGPADDSDDGDCLVGSSLHTSWTRC